MTARERQILQWIEEDPLISQEELAKKAGITRSSVGVYVSSLTKQGYLAGRGYVLVNRAEVAVVGGVNVDIGGVPINKLIARDSNPGKVTTALGGVGRNVAHNLALLGRRVRLAAALGDDANAALIERSCLSLGIDLTLSRRVPGARTSTYLYIANETGDMALAVADMEICDHMTPEYLSSILPALNASRVVVADANLPAKALSFLASRLTVPLFVDPVSVTKAQKLAGCLAGVHTLKPNLIEAALLSGVEIKSRLDVPKAAKALLGKGVRRVFISLGADGVYASDGSAEGFFPCAPANVVSTTGAGDAFTAGLVTAFLDGMDLAASARFAAAAAAVAIASPDTVSPEMSREKVEEKMQNAKYITQN